MYQKRIKYWIGVIFLITWISQIPYLWPFPNQQINTLLIEQEKTLNTTPDWMLDAPISDGETIRETFSKNISDPSDLINIIWLLWFLQICFILFGCGFAILLIRGISVAGIASGLLGILFILIVSQPWEMNWLWDDIQSWKGVIDRYMNLSANPTLMLSITHINIILPLVYILLPIAFVFGLITSDEPQDANI